MNSRIGETPSTSPPPSNRPVPTKLEVKDTNDTPQSASSIALYFKIDNG